MPAMPVEARRTKATATGSSAVTVRRAFFLLPLLAAGCGWVPADEQVLTTFFEQSRLNDTTRVAGVATVVFDPRVEGVVDRFRITERSDRPLDGNRLQREAMLAAHVRSGDREYDRTLRVTMERGVDGRWMVRGYRWTS
jgi:hypothetical protein